MKRFMFGIFAALIIGALVSASAFAGDKSRSEKESVVFTQDVMVNGTLIKAGEYQVKFDESTGELSILKNGKVKAKTAAHIEARSDKAKSTSVRIVDKGGSVAELAGVTFDSWHENVVVGGGGSTTGMQ